MKVLNKLKITAFLSIIVLFLSCIDFDKKSSKKQRPPVTDSYEKSFKELKDNDELPANSEHYDSINNIYSNYLYKVAFDGPNHWHFDPGVGDHTIFRTYELDSAITFQINVIQTKLSSISEEDKIDPWELYIENKESLDYVYKTLIPKKLNTTIQNFEASKTYLNNRTVIKRIFNYDIKDLDLEYNNTCIIYQTFIDNFTYTFQLDIPTMFYEQKPNSYEDLFRNIYFLSDKNAINNLFK